jgi:hypothetical protein
MATGLPQGVWAHLVARVHAVSDRPRMALLVALLLVERADDAGVVQTSRADLSHALWALVGERGYQHRREARHQRIAPLLDERRTVVAQAREAIRHAPPHALTRLLIAGAFNALLGDIDAAIGDPTGQNISHIMGELVEAGVLASRSYIDAAGRRYDKPARGRIYALTLADWLRPVPEASDPA